MRGMALVTVSVGLLACSPAPDGPDVLLVNATGRDHPRRAGLAVHLGARLDLPTVGVTNRLLVAAGEWPDDRRGATCLFHLDGEPGFPTKWIDPGCSVGDWEFWNSAVPTHTRIGIWGRVVWLENCGFGGQGGYTFCVESLDFLPTEDKSWSHIKALYND